MLYLKKLQEFFASKKNFKIRKSANEKLKLFE